MGGAPTLSLRIEMTNIRRKCVSMLLCMFVSVRVNVCTCVCVYVGTWVCLCVCMCAYGVGIGDEEWGKGGGEEGTVAGRAALGLMIPPPSSSSSSSSPPPSSASCYNTEYTPSAICMNILEQWFP